MNPAANQSLKDTLTSGLEGGMNEKVRNLCSRFFKYTF